MIWSTVSCYLLFPSLPSFSLEGSLLLFFRACFCDIRILHCAEIGFRKRFSPKKKRTISSVFPNLALNCRKFAPTENCSVLCIILKSSASRNHVLRNWEKGALKIKASWVLGLHQMGFEFWGSIKFGMKGFWRLCQNWCHSKF